MSKNRQPKKRGAPISFNNLSNPWQRFRSQTGLGQIGLAAALNVSQNAICNYEKSPGTKGHRWPRRDIALRFITLAKQKRVRMSLEEIFPTTGERQPGEDREQDLRPADQIT